MPGGVGTGRAGHYAVAGGGLHGGVWADVICNLFCRARAPAQQPGDRRWLVLGVVAIAQLMVVLDATIVNIALPSAQRALGFPNSDRQWVVTAYALAFGSLLLVGGRLGDMYNRKWVFITGLIGFAVSLGHRGRGRVVRHPGHGAGAAGRVRRAARAVGPGHTRPARSRIRESGAGRSASYGSVAAGGGGIGLILGGVLTQYLSWRYCLYVNLIFAAIAVAGRPALHPRRPPGCPAATGLARHRAGLRRALPHRLRILPRRDRGLDRLAHPRLPGPGPGAPRRIRSRRAAAPLIPLLPLRVLMDRTRGGSYVALFISGIAIFGTFLFLTFYLQLIKGESPLTTGLLFLPMIGCILISSNLASVVLLPRAGPRVLIASGMLLGSRRDGVPDPGQR